MSSAGRAEPVFGRSLAAAGADARRWRLLALVAACVGMLAFAVNVAVSELHSGNAWGLAYGVVALLLMLSAAALALRRRSLHRSLRVGLGASRAWLYVHLYGGALFLLFLGMHTGFAAPGGPLAWCLWLLALWTVATGLLGLGLQQWLPKVMTSALAIEVHYDRIPELVDDVARRAAEVADEAGDDVRRLHQRRVAEAVVRPRRHLRYLLDPKGTVQAQLAPFEALRPLLDETEGARLDELEQLYRSKLEMDAHYTLQQPLRLWLYLHVPTSILLLGAVGLHLFSVWNY